MFARFARIYIKPTASPGANLLFPNRSAMARVLSLWRSIEKKTGLNLKLVGSLGR